MSAINRILLPIDFSERSSGAARYARTLAERYSSRVTLLHVITPAQYELGALEIGGSMLADLYANRNAAVAADLENFAAEHFSGIETERLVLEGDPARLIVTRAHDDSADLIVMPTHGYGPFRRFILGSIAAKVLHDADCPVWTGIHLEAARDEAPVHFRNVLCALDLGPHTGATLRWAAEFQKVFGTRLSVVHASTSQPGDEGQWRPKVEEALIANAREIEQEVGVEIRTFVEAGDPPRVVCTAAERLQADLLVIGRGTARGVFGRLRANAYAIIRQSPCPVVSV